MLLLQVVAYIIVLIQIYYMLDFSHGKHINFKNDMKLKPILRN